MSDNQQRSVEQWMEYIQTLHFREIEMGLERVNEVYQRLIPEGVNYSVISIAGTNGKGSTAEMLSSIYDAAGYQVGKFTSPHLVEYGERFCVNGKVAPDKELLTAFERIENARAEIPLTYFEFGTLMAIELFHAAEVDLAIMEVGMGGRLDAVNILDADIAVITSISIDHTGWLGNSVDEIAPEKMGIARAGRPCIVGLTELSPKMQTVASEIGFQLQQIGNEFSYSHNSTDTNWSYRSEQNNYIDLPLPFSQSGVQLSNASLALRSVELFSNLHPVSIQQIRQGLSKAQLLARCQIINTKPYVVVDVAHNESSIARLAEFLIKLNGARYVAVCGMLKDKEIAKSMSHLYDLIEDWHLATIDNERGSSAEDLQAILQKEVFLEPRNTHCYENVNEAFICAKNTLSEHDVLVVFGSFLIAGDILQALGDHGLNFEHH